MFLISDGPIVHGILFGEYSRKEVSVGLVVQCILWGERWQRKLLAGLEGILVKGTAILFYDPNSAKRCTLSHRFFINQIFREAQCLARARDKNHLPSRRNSEMWGRAGCAIVNTNISQPLREWRTPFPFSGNKVEEMLRNIVSVTYISLAWTWSP